MPLTPAFYRHLQSQDTPRCCFGQLGSKSASFGLVPKIWSESLYVSERRLWKDWGKKKKKDLQIPNTCAWTISVILHPSFASSLWTADRQDSSYSTTRKQTIDYERYISNKNPLGRQGTVHTHAHVHTCIDGLQERVSCCQKTTAVGCLSYYFPAALLPVCLCDINSTNLTCTADVEWWKVFSQCVSAERFSHWNGLHWALRWRK